MTRMLAELFDGWLIDLDGVVYIDDRALPGAREAVLTLRERGSRILFLTNDPRSSRGEYAEKLTRLGIPAEADDLVTAGWAAADFLVRERLTDRSVFVIGSAALRAEMERVGCRVVEGSRRDGRRSRRHRGVRQVRLRRSHHRLHRGPPGRIFGRHGS